MSACSEVLLVGWLLLVDPIVMKSIEAASTSQSYRNNNQHLEISATDDRSICTSNGIDYVLFSDQSQMDAANRKKHATEAAYEKVAMGFCQTQCNLVCATVNIPICAVDEATGLQRSFNNPCEMSRDACLNNIAWKLQTSGPCSATQEKTKPILIEPERNPTRKGRTPIICTKVFNPVCAIFAGVKSTFNNECLVYAENIKTGNDWTIFSNGVCAEDYTSFGYNADQIKYNNVRSFGKTISHDKDSEAERYYDDMTIIYTSPIIHTEYVDETFAQNFNYPATALESTYNPHQFRYSLNTQTVYAETEKPIRLIESNNELSKVIRCKYGSRSICGTYKNRYRSFENVCELMLRNILLNQTWTTAYAGYCIKNSCPQQCSKEYAPICVSKNGVNLTISNMCYLDMKQCQDTQSTWKILAKGECEQKILPYILSKTTTTTSLPIRKFEPAGLVSRIDNKYSTTTVLPTSSTSYKSTTIAMASKSTTKMAPITIIHPSTTRTTVYPIDKKTTTKMVPITTIPPPSTKTTTTISSPKAVPPSSTTTTTTLKSITGLTFDTQKSITTPKHYVSLTTSAATKTTTPLTLSPYHSTTKAPVTTFLISAKTAPVISSRTSIYGANRNSVIMRLAKAKGPGGAIGYQ